MSTVQCNEWRGPQTNNHCITMPSGSSINATGQVLQTVWRRFDYPTTYALPAGSGGNGTIFGGLDLKITKKISNSWVYCQWWLFYETHHDVVFRTFRNGTCVGYNTLYGLVPYSGITTAEYEYTFDNNSTPSVLHMAFQDYVDSTAELTYSLGAIGGTTTYNIMINVPTNTGATDNYERGVSWAMLEEIAYY